MNHVPPAAPEVIDWRRMHPLTPLLQGGLALVVILGIIIANLRDRFIDLFIGDSQWTSTGEGDVIALIVDEGLVLIALGAVAVLILLIVVFSWLSWRFHSYRISEDAVEARKGLLFRQHRRAPLDRIQSVNLQRPLLARVLGLTKIEVQTGGQGGKVELAYLSHADAKTVRRQILRSAAHSRGLAPTAMLDPGEPGTEGSASEAEGAPHPLTSTTSGSASALDGLDHRAREFIDDDIDPEAHSSGRLVTVPVGRLLGSIMLGWDVVIAVVLIIVVPILAMIWSWALLAGLLPLILVLIGVAFGQFNKGFRFTLSRASDEVRTGSGLTATTTETIPLGRIHTVEVLQPLLWRPLGWWKVRINTAGHSLAQGGQNAARNVVLPVGFEDDALRVIETILPGSSDQGSGGQDDSGQDHTEALRDGLVGPAHGYLGAGPRAGWVLWWGRRRAGIEVTSGEHATVRIRRGALTRSFVVMPVVRAQSIQLRRPLVHRMIGLASLRAHTVLGPIGVEMRGIELGQAQHMFDQLADTVVRVQSGEADRRTEPGQAEQGASR